MFLVPVDDATLRHIPQVTEKHSLCDLRDTLPQLVRSHRPIQQSP